MKTTKRKKRWPDGTWMQVNREVLVEEMGIKGFSLDRLARYAGCSKGMVSHLASGRRTSCTPALAENIAEAMGMSVRSLFVPRLSTEGAQIVRGTKTGARAA